MDRRTTVAVWVGVTCLFIVSVSAYWAIGQYRAAQLRAQSRDYRPPRILPSVPTAQRKSASPTHADDADQEAVARAMRAQKSGMDVCWSRRRDRSSIVLSFTLGLRGEVSDPTVTAGGAALDPADEQCILDWARGLRLPAPKHGPVKLEWEFAV